MSGSDSPSSSGINMTSNSLPTSTSTMVTDVTTVSLRPQDVQAIVTGLASNPDALAAVALMIRAEQQPNLGLPQSSASANQGQPSKLFFTI